VLKIENIPSNKKQTIVKPTLPRRNKIILPMSHNIRPMKPIKPKLRSVSLMKNLK